MSRPRTGPHALRRVHEHLDGTVSFSDAGLPEEEAVYFACDRRDKAPPWMRGMLHVVVQCAVCDVDLVITPGMLETAKHNAPFQLRCQACAALHGAPLN